MFVSNITNNDYLNSPIDRNLKIVPMLSDSRLEKSQNRSHRSRHLVYEKRGGCQTTGAKTNEWEAARQLVSHLEDEGRVSQHTGQWAPRGSGTHTTTEREYGERLHHPGEQKGFERKGFLLLKI